MKRMEKRGKKKKNRIILLLLIMVGAIFGGMKLNEFSKKQTEQQRIVAEEQKEIQLEQQKKEQEKQEKIQKQKEDMQTFIAEMQEKERILVEQGTNSIKSNSDEMVGYILARASQDARDKPILAGSKDFESAFQFLVDNYPNNYFSSNEMLEETMYFSKVVLYAYEPRWKNYKGIDVNFDEVYTLWDDSELKNKHSFVGDDLTRVTIADNVGDTARNIYLNMETANSANTKDMLKDVGLALNDLYYTDEYWKDPTQQPKTQVQTQTQTQTQTVQQPVVEEKKEKMVWIPTNGGIKYHLDKGCSKMIDPIQVTEDEAKSRGFDMCKKCYG